MASRTQASLASYHDLATLGFEVGTASTDSTAGLLLADADLAALRGIHKDCELTACLGRLVRRTPRYGLLFSRAVMEYLIPLYFLVSRSAWRTALHSPILLHSAALLLSRRSLLHAHIDDDTLCNVLVNLRKEKTSFSSFSNCPENKNFVPAKRKFWNKFNNISLQLSSENWLPRSKKVQIPQDGAGQPFIEEIPTPALPTYVSLYLRKGDPLAREMDNAFLRFLQSGLPDRWLAKVTAGESGVRPSRLNFRLRAISYAGSRKKFGLRSLACACNKD